MWMNLSHLCKFLENVVKSEQCLPLRSAQTDQKKNEDISWAFGGLKMLIHSGEGYLLCRAHDSNADHILKHLHRHTQSSV
ncbi:hypothetical protein LEMLEM_LOCUS12333 [Lemmus lemmus]